jgi:hypothetical protein
MTALLALSATAAFADKPEFTLPALGTFDGAHFGQLTLGTTTASDVKGQYKIDRNGGNTPWSLRVSTPKGSGYRVFTLFSGPNDHSDTLNAILIQYESGPTQDMVAQDLGDQGTPYYIPGRNSNWHVEDFADKGAVAFVNDVDRVDTVDAVMLIRPSVVQNGILNLSTEPTAIVPVVDLHAREPKVMHFGNIDVDTYELDGLHLRDSRIREIRDDIELASAQGTMIYEAYAAGTYKVEFSGDYKWDKGGSVTVTCTISGESPYGPVSAKGEETESIDKHTRVDDYDFYGDALHDARANAERNFAKAMRAAGPPTPAETRRMAWDDLFNILRQKSLTDQKVMARVPPSRLFISFP